MLQLATIEPFTLGLLKELMTRAYMKPFFLVGGTALALQMGHRKSIDLDFFSLQDFDKDLLLHQLQQEFDVTVDLVTPSLFLTRINEVKIDFVRFRHTLQYPLLDIDGVRMPDIRDLAPMKLDAVTKRGSKKDFFDIYYLLKQMPLSTLLNFYSQKYQHSTLFHVIKSLTYFEDAESDFNPVVLDKKTTWLKVKKTIQKAVIEIYK